MQRVSLLRRVFPSPSVPQRKSWVRKLADWWDRPAVKKLVLEIPLDEYQRLAEEAAGARQPLEDWVLQRLRFGSRPSPAILDEAFRRLDLSDAQREFSDEPPEPQIPKAPEARVEALGKPLPSTHACVYHVELLRTDGGPPKVCAHSGQIGRPCYFPSNRAPDCMVFAPKKQG